MDTLDYDYWVQFMRIKSKRQKRRLVREDRDKLLIRKHNEQKAIWAEYRNLGWVELKPPVQRGFIRFFVLRADVARTKDAPFYQKILDKINTYQWSSRGDFKRKRRRFGKKVYVEQEQQLLDVYSFEFFRRFSDQERLCFYESMTHFGKATSKVFRFADTWRFVLRIQPNMITKVRVKDLDLDKRSQELDRFFNTKRKTRLWKLLYGGKAWGWKTHPDRKYANPLRNKSVATILEDHWPDRSMEVSFRNPRKTRGFSFMPMFGKLAVYQEGNETKEPSLRKIYSLLKLWTGFPIADFIDSKLTVINAMANASIPAHTKTTHPIGVLYSNVFNHFSIPYHASGTAMTKAISTSFKNSVDIIITS